MRVMWAVAAVSVLAGTSMRADISTSERNRVRSAAEVIREFRAIPDKGIPDELWSRAECVLVIPSVKKAALVVGGEYGKGVMSCRTSNGWSAPVFMEMAKASWGLQIGAQENDLVLLVINRRGVEKMLDDHINLGADASIAAGPVGRTGQAGTDLQMSAEILSYSRSHGLFAGIDLSGGVLRPDKDSNQDVYGSSHPAENIVRGSVAVPLEVREFVTSLGTDVRATSGRR